MAAGNDDNGAELELTYNYGVSSYELGSAFGHLALGVPDVAAACERIRAAGGKVHPRGWSGEGRHHVIAFVEDPDGYKIELIEGLSLVRLKIPAIFPAHNLLDRLPQALSPLFMPFRG